MTTGYPDNGLKGKMPYRPRTGLGLERSHQPPQVFLLDMRDQEGWGNKFRVLPTQPDLVASIPGRRVEVAHEDRILKVFSDKCMEP